MKTPALFLLAASLIVVPLSHTEAAKNGNKKKGVAATEGAAPGKELVPYIEHLDALLLLQKRD